MKKTKLRAIGADVKKLLKQADNLDLSSGDPKDQLLLSLLEVLSNLSTAFTQLNEELIETQEQLEDLEEDLCEIEEVLLEEDDDFDEELDEEDDFDIGYAQEPFSKMALALACPHCSEQVSFSLDQLNEDSSPVCPLCLKAFFPK